MERKYIEVKRLPPTPKKKAKKAKRRKRTVTLDKYDKAKKKYWDSKPKLSETGKEDFDSVLGALLSDVTPSKKRKKRRARRI